MNPFLSATVAAVASPARAAAPARRTLRHVAFMAGLGLAACGSAYAVDVNTATETQLEAVRGIGPKTAAEIVREREEGGAYGSFDELSERVRGLGSRRLQQFRRAGLTLGGGASRGAPRIIVNTPTGGRDKAR